MIYLDNNATTRILPEVVQVMAEASSDVWGNPSSIHSLGQKARQKLTSARRTIATQSIRNHNEGTVLILTPSILVARA